MLWLPAVLWMTVIFCFSAQTATESDSVSGQTIHVIAEKVIPDFPQKTEAEKQDIIRRFQHAARKTAHFAEYAILGIFISLALVPYRLKEKSRFLIAWISCIYYASSDEIHQYFVPGRGPGGIDVLIDSCGALFGILLFRIVYKWIITLRYSVKRSKCK